jgi:hypothetical protein
MGDGRQTTELPDAPIHLDGETEGENKQEELRGVVLLRAGYGAVGRGWALKRAEANKGIVAPKNRGTGLFLIGLSPWRILPGTKFLENGTTVPDQNCQSPLALSRGNPAGAKLDLLEHDVLAFEDVGKSLESIDEQNMKTEHRVILPTAEQSSVGRL